MTPAKRRLAQAAMGKRETTVGALCEELGIARSTLYRHVSPSGELRVGPHGEQFSRDRSDLHAA
jgi:hypothetical protein